MQRNNRPVLEQKQAQRLNLHIHPIPPLQLPHQAPIPRVLLRLRVLLHPREPLLDRRPRLRLDVPAPEPSAHARAPVREGGAGLGGVHSREPGRARAPVHRPLVVHLARLHLLHLPDLPELPVRVPLVVLVLVVADVRGRLGAGEVRDGRRERDRVFVPAEGVVEHADEEVLGVVVRFGARVPALVQDVLER